jgi:hypothetical protein
MDKRVHGSPSGPHGGPIGPPPFRSRYKLHGMIAAVAIMWLDFAYIYHGLIASDPGIVSAGMAVMVAAAAIAYYFG